VHIRRNPYAVFQSFVHTYATGLPFGRLQRTSEIDWTGRVIRQYKEVYDSYFEERGLIRDGHLHEMSFEELEQNPVAEMQKLYEALGMPDFANVEPALRAYLHSLRDYRKNSFPELDSEVRKRIASEWRRCFEEWDYPV
jgi:hypothetical protein